VEPLYLFDLASAQQHWLAIRQTVTAQNVANANTPGYKAMEVAPFSDVYDATAMRMATTQADHMEPDTFDLNSIAEKETSPWEVTYSGNTVSLEQEMLNANEVNRDYSLNMSLMKSFNQMLSMSTKGPGA
jgi:flagellar basal-body rod protein FlgB